MNTETTNVSSNKLAVIHVLAALIQNPLLFADNNYNFSIEDFPEQFHKILFSAIEHLAKNGMETIGYIDIDQFLKQYTVQYKVFSMNKGVEYIQNAMAMYNPKKFDYYYHTLKKHSLINKLNAKGIDTTDVYDPNIIDPVASAKMHERFDSLTVNDILLLEDTKLILLKEEFGSNTDRVENHAGDGLKALKERLKETPDMGMPLLSPKMTTILRGQRQGCLFIESAPSGFGKALPNSSKLPTPNGWRTVGDIRVGDQLFDATGKVTTVVDIFPQGKKRVFEITLADGRTVKCCDEHLWSYNTPGQKPNSIEQRKFITKTLREIIQDGPLKNSSGWRVQIPQQKAVEYAEVSHFLPPYVMGLLLGNGSFRGQSTNNMLSISSKDMEIPQSIAQSDALIEHPELINADSHTKFIPQCYLQDSISNRLDLLNGLLDADGTVDSKGRIKYFTVSEQLCDNVVELARSLGFTTSVYQDTHKDTGVCYIIHITGSPVQKCQLFRLPRKHDRIMKYYQNIHDQLRTQNHNNVAIVDIKDLGYEEEMTCFLVDNEEHLFLTDDFVVTHNSRRGNGEACHLAIPEYYDTIQKKWIKTNLHESVLIISTELEEYECQQMWMSFVAGVPENHIKDGRYYAGEEERVDRAIELIEKSNLYFVSITNYDTDDIVNTIKKYKQLHDVNYVFFDYLGESLKITASASRQTRVSGLRTDQILLMMSSALKDCAKTLGIYIWTASQLSGDYQNAKQLDAGYLRSAKSIADKVDAGYILMPVREQDQSVIDSYCAKGFELAPNFVISVYKVRAGSYQNIKVYINFDRSTCQVHDCFVTDVNGVILPVEDTNIEIMLDETREEKFESAYTGKALEETKSSEFAFDF